MRALLVACLVLHCAAAAAQIRPIPSEAQVGNMRHLQFMMVELDGEPRELAPGVQIRDIENRIVLPGTLEERQPVRYMLDSAGMIFRVWMLSGQEKEALPPEPSPYPR